MNYNYSTIKNFVYLFLFIYFIPRYFLDFEMIKSMIESKSSIYLISTWSFITNFLFLRVVTTTRIFGRIKLLFWMRTKSRHYTKHTFWKTTDIVVTDYQTVWFGTGIWDFVYLLRLAINRKDLYLINRHAWWFSR